MTGTQHVGVRKLAGSRAWETFDRETSARIGPLHPTRYEAQAYAEHRRETTYGVTETESESRAAYGDR